MRTNFNFYFEPPEDVVLAPKALPIYPSRLEPQEKLKIEVTPQHRKTDWLKLTVGFLGVTTAIVGTLLGSQMYYQHKTQLVENAKEVLDAPTAPVAVQVPQPIQKTLIEATPASVSADSNSVPASSAGVTNQESAAAEVSSNEPIKAEPQSEPIKQTQSQPIIEKQQPKTATQSKPAVAHTSTAPAPAPQNQTTTKTPPVLQPVTQNNAVSTVTVPKFIIANDNNQQPASQQKQTGIFKRPVQVDKPKTDTPAATGKQESSTQKLF